MPLLSPAEALEKTAALQAADASGKILAHVFNKVSADDSGKEPARRDLAGIMAHKWRDHIPGGLAEGKKPSDFPAEDLVRGMTAEMEHTNDPAVACEIAMDHMVEKADYYRKGDMAKEVAESFGNIEDGAITLAKHAGVLVAQMSKMAWNPLGAVKKLITPAVGRLAKPIEGAAVKGVVGGAEHSMGRVLPMTHPGHVPTATGGFANANTVMDAGATLRNPTMPTARARTGSLASPAGNQMPTRPGNPLVARVQEAQQRAVNQGNLHSVVGNAKAQAKAQIPGTPTRAVNIPEGNLGPERRVGADEWISNHPDEALNNRLLSAKLNPSKVVRGSSPVGQLHSPTEATTAASLPGAAAPPTKAPVAQPVTRPSWASKLDQEMGPVAKSPPESVAKNLRKVRGKSDIQVPGWVDSPQTSANIGVARDAAVPNVAAAQSAPATAQGSVASPGVAVKRFGVGKALGVGALGLGAYGAAKAIPWAAKQVDETSSMPLAYGGGWSPTPYGYGSTPYGPGVQTMGPGA